MDPGFSITYVIVLLGLSGSCLAMDISVYSGHLGETLTIICPYQQRGDRWGKKLWCKEDDLGFCELVVSANRYWQNFATRTNGSTNISDNKYKGIVTINMTNLQKNDAGVYQCRRVTFSDVSTLQRIRVKVLEDELPGNVSEVEKVQYSLSGSSSESLVPLTWIILGSSLLLCKLLVMGLIFSWWKREQSRSATQEPAAISSSEEVISAGDRYDEPFLPGAREEPNACPQYMNYVYMGHLNQAHWGQ